MAANLEQVVTQNAECPVCLNYFNEPKQLACTHTFCLGCLSQLYESRQKANQISCPVCRENTDVREGGVSTLPTNIPVKSMVEDIKNAQRTGRQICTNCNLDDEPLAETYCQDCEEYLCVSCHEVHDKWKKNCGHQVITMTDIKSGKASIKKQRKCKIHPVEEEEFYCWNCRKYICFRCRVLEHNKAEHYVMDAKKHKKKYKEQIESLQQQAETKKRKISEYLDIVEEQRKKMKTIFEQRTKKIDQAYEESMQQLKQRRDELVHENKEHKQKLDSKLSSMKDEICVQYDSISRGSELVGNGTKATPEGQALIVHDTLCSDLRKVLYKTEPDCSLPRYITQCAQGVKFIRSCDDVLLGTVKEEGVWVLRKDIAFAEEKIVNGMAPMKDGKMAVAYKTGGIQVFSIDGPQGIILRDKGIRNISFLSDGCCVLRDVCNNISIYTALCENLDVPFHTLSYDDGGHGGLAVDKDDFIYISYRKVNRIQVFRKTGDPVRPIICNGYFPWKIFAMKSNNMLVVMDGSSVRVIDQRGRQKYDIRKAGVGVLNAIPAVCRDDTILIAWVKVNDGLVTIEKYSHELKRMETLVTDYKIQIPQRNWYCLQEFRSGEVAFCTPDRLYIFQKPITPADVIEGQ